MRSHLRKVARLFLRLGFTAFGGPAAHIAMLRIVMERSLPQVGRRWGLNERLAKPASGKVRVVFWANQAIMEAVELGCST